MKEKDCIFCRIANGEIPASTIYEDDDFRVIMDLSPAAKGHALILPKEHYPDLCELDAELASKVFPLAGRLGRAMKQALGCNGFNVVQNNGTEAGQTVFHFHTHIIPRYRGGAKIVGWIPGESDQEELQKTAATIQAAL